MPSPPPTSNKHQDRESAKQRVVRVFREDSDWCTATIHNDLSYLTARRAIMSDGADTRKRDGVRPSRVKMTVTVMAALEEMVDEDARMLCSDMRDHLRSRLGVSSSRTSVHRALQDMLYSLKQLRIEKVSMNNSISKAKRKAFVERLNGHVEQGNMIVFQGETNFNVYLLRRQGLSRVSKRATVAFLSSQGKNLHSKVTHDGSIGMQEKARFIADLFVAALCTEEFRQLEPTNKVVVITNNAPAHSRIEELAREQLVADGIMNGGRLVILRLAPYSPY